MAGAALTAMGNIAAADTAAEMNSRLLASRATMQRGVVAMGWKDEARPVERKRMADFMVERLVCLRCGSGCEL